MPVTVRNTDILFNDGSTQNTAAGAVTTTAVLNATAGGAAGAVGTYAFLTTVSVVQNAAAYNAGTTHAGSNLRYVNHANQGLNTAASGTWRSMGWAATSQGFYGETIGGGGTVFLRIS